MTPPEGPNALTDLAGRAWLGLRDFVEGLEAAERLGPLLQALALLVAGILLARAARFAVRRWTSGLSAQQRMLLVRGVGYTVFGLFAVSALRELGFDFAVLLGAAGIVTVAVGFASQTSASNLISGLFLVFERTIEVGDVITVEGVTGEVLSIDLLSTRLRTFDNLLVRIPNETMVKARITNLNRFPIRRYDLLVGVAYKEDIAHVKRVLLEVADRNPLCLEEPAPLIIAQGYGASSVDFQLSVWAKTENYLDLRNSIHEEVKEAFDREGIEIPYPHVSVYAGALTEAIPMRMIPPDAEENSGERSGDA